MNSTDLFPSKNIRPFPTFTRPVIEGFFSIDEHRKYQNSLEQLKYLKIPQNIDFDLNAGDDTYVYKPQSAEEEKIDHLLQYLMINKSSITKHTNPDFVCFRGLLTMIMLTPYEDDEPWIVIATKYKNTIFLCNERTERAKATRMRQTERDKKFMRYGFKFESFILSNDPARPAHGSSMPIKEAEEFSAMFSTCIGGKKILYGAELDGVISDKPCENLDDINKVKKVEVKVKRRETNERQVSNFYKFKGIKWWLQSFLVGIETIHVGLRNDDGIVDDVQPMSIKQIADEAKRKNFWHGTVCFNFLNSFLTTISRDMRHIDDPYLVHRYQFNRHQSDFITFEKFKGIRHSFLTPEYITSMETL